MSTTLDQLRRYNEAERLLARAIEILDVAHAAHIKAVANKGE